MRAKRYETTAIRHLNAIPERPALTACREPSAWRDQRSIFVIRVCRRALRRWLLSPVCRQRAHEQPAPNGMVHQVVDDLLEARA
jgi:hypothetical protein